MSERGRDKVKGFGPASTNPEKRLKARRWASETRDRSRRRARIANQENVIDPHAAGKHILNLDKHVGRTIAEVYQEDPEYLRWIVDESSASEATRRLVARFLASRKEDRRKP